MAKTTGKQAVAPEAAAEEKVQNGVFLNSISDKMIQPATKDGGPSKDGKNWMRVGVSLPGNKIGNIMVLDSQILPASSFTKGKDGEKIRSEREGAKNIVLGKGKKFEVQLNEKDEQGHYKSIEMTSEELVDQHKLAVKEYRDAKKAVERETPEVAGAAAPEAEAELPDA
jgi:hypothetical protein